MQFEPMKEEPESVPELNDSIPVRSTLDNMDDLLYGKEVAFFEKGRDYKPADHHHLFTMEEKAQMATYEALDYRLPNNQVRRNHVWTSAQRDYQKWTVFLFIGLIIGTVSFLLYQCIGFLDYERLYLKDYPLKFVACSTGYGIISAAVVAFGAPVARGSGVPQVIGYLNGVRQRHIFRVRAILVKFVSCAFSVASGLPVGQEGPMIALGAAIGAGVGTGSSDTLHFNTCGFFKYFQNSKDIRDFISGGVAAGVSAAFNAPVGGLLFTMEECSSFWSKQLSWQMFFGCMSAVLWTNLWKSGYSGWSGTGGFGLISPSLISFQVSRPDHYDEQFLILVVFPAMLIGLVSGTLASIFTFINLKVTRFRIKHINNNRWLCVLETTLVCLAWGMVSVTLPAAGSCFPLQGIYNDTHPVQSNCQDGYYNDMASLTLNGGHGAVNDMLSRGTFGFYSGQTLLLWLFCYFLFAAYTAGMTPAVGSFVPMLYIGALIGRFFGRAFLTGEMESWGDPGLYALIGCGCFGAGLSRLTMALAVIMIEISDSVSELLPLMVGIMIAKFVADFITHSLDHSILHILSVPYLSPTLADSTLPCFNVSEIMTKDPACLPICPSIGQIVDVLKNTTHAAFPVVVDDISLVPRRFHSKHGKNINITKKEQISEHKSSAKFNEGDFSDGYLVGLIHRNQLLQLLQHTTTLFANTIAEARKVMEVMEDYDFEAGRRGLLNTNHISAKQKSMFMDLSAYVDTSTVSLPHTFDIQYAYEIFLTLGLRHLVIINSLNSPVGMLTRKDLQGQAIEERLEHLHQNMANDHADHVASSAIRRRTVMLKPRDLASLNLGSNAPNV